MYGTKESKIQSRYNEKAEELRILMQKSTCY